MHIQENNKEKENPFQFALTLNEHVRILWQSWEWVRTFLKRITAASVFAEQSSAPNWEGKDTKSTWLASYNMSHTFLKVTSIIKRAHVIKT